MAIDGLFETMRVYKGRVFAQEAHIARMINSCAVLGIRPPDKDLLNLAIRSIIKEKRLKESRLKIEFFRINKYSQIRISSKELPCFKKGLKGFALFLSEADKLPIGINSTVKSLKRAFYENVFKKAKGRGYDEALFLNTRGEVVEGTRTNVFLIKGKKVVTPALSSGCLPGVTRGIVIGLMKKMKIPCDQRGVAPAELFESSGMFLTNSIIGVVPVERLNNKFLKESVAIELIQKIAALYRKEIERECSPSNK